MVQNTAKNVSCITTAFHFHENVLRMTSESTLTTFSQPEDGQDSSSEMSEQIYTTQCMNPKDHLDLMIN